MNTGTQAILFQPRNEPNENAFSLLVPQGWLVEGGIQRANLMNQVVSAQTIEAKVDFALKRDPQGSVMLRVNRRAHMAVLHDHFGIPYSGR